MRFLASTAAALGLLAPLISQAPTLDEFRYDRQLVYPLISPQNPSPNACAIVDANVFAHASGGLADLRVFNPSGRLEIPYVVTLSSASASSDPAHIVRTSATGALKAKPQLDLDLEMPERPYSEVDLTLNARDFVASAHVTGLRTRNDPHPVFLGDVNLFDLSAQHLGGRSAIPIAESTFPYLHLRLTFEPAPGNAALLVTPSTVASADVPPARQAQTLYTGIAQSFASKQQGSQTVTTFTVPARVPIERVSFELAPDETANFNRSITVSATAGPTEPTETLSGGISRVHLHVGQREVQAQSLSVPAILGSNALAPASVSVAIDNGAQPPLKIRTVRLEMRQRQLCFPADGTMATLAYGHPSAQASTYDFARQFNASSTVRRATLLHEQANSLFIEPVAHTSFAKRYSGLLRLGLLAAVCLGCVVVYSALDRRHRDSLRG